VIIPPINKVSLTPSVLLDSSRMNSEVFECIVAGGNKGWLGHVALGMSMSW
jgi:hypothetical protein